MVRAEAAQAWVDQYLRDELTASEIAEFEQALMDSPGLQQELENALALREILKHDTSAAEDKVASRRFFPVRAGARLPAGLAAAIALAVFSTLMFWKVSSDAEGLREALAVQAQPVSGILTVPVDLMRAAPDSRSPDVVVVKPPASQGILLDIELAPASRDRGELGFSLSRADGARVVSWRGTPTADGRAQVLFRSEQLPAGRLWLEIASGEDQPLERRLLEFR